VGGTGPAPRRTGSDAVIEMADLVLMAIDLARLADAVRLPPVMVGINPQDIVIAASVVAALLLGAVAGNGQLAGGMLMHELYVLVVSLNALRPLRP
jgi:Zn2+/Cd2+-exporting ATPase